MEEDFITNETTEEIYERILPIITDYRYFSKKSFGEYDIKEYLLRAIEELKDEYDGKEDFDDYLIDKLIKGVRYEGNKDPLVQYYNEVRNYPRLSKEEESDLIDRMDQGDPAAKEKLIKCNLKLVIPVARRLATRKDDEIDLVQEGNIGLIKGIEKYDRTKGMTLATYATFNVANEIIRYQLNRGSLIRIPIYLGNYYYLYSRAVDAYLEMYDDAPLDEEIAKMLLLPVYLMKKCRLLSRVTNSLDEPFEDGELKDVIRDEETDTAEQALYITLVEELNNAIDEMKNTERNKDMLLYRYGYYDGVEHSLDETGNRYNLTRESARQIIARELHQLRMSSQALDMADYRDNPKKARETIVKYRKLELTPKDIIKSNVLDQVIEPENKSSKKVDTIYTLFNGHSKEEVDDALKKIGKNELLLVHRKYGKDLEHPEESSMLDRDKINFYGKVLPTLKGLLFDKEVPFEIKQGCIRKLVNESYIVNKIYNESSLSMDFPKAESITEDANEVDKEKRLFR